MSVGGAVDSMRTTPAAKFLCFSDQQSLPVPLPWQKRPLDAAANSASGHFINRYHKFFPHRVLPACEFSIYHDGNIRFDADYSTLVARLRLQGAAMGAFRHPAARDLQAELTACETQGKFDTAEGVRAREQLAHYRASGFDCSQVISANYLLVRDHSHPELDRAMALWWEQINTYAGRDQLSLGFALWKAGLPFAFLDDSAGAFPVRQPHRGERFRKRWARIRSLVGG